MLPRPLLAAGLLFTVIVIVAGVPAEDGVTELGLIVQLVPLGAPLQYKLTASVNPFCPVTLIFTCPLCPTETDNEVLESVPLKSATFSFADAECVANPFDNATVKV
jgi:hypothetical protein